MADNKLIKYVITLSYNPDTKKAKLISEEFIDDGEIESLASPILFKGNIWVLDYMDEEAISSINVYEIGET